MSSKTVSQWLSLLECPEKSRSLCDTYGTNKEVLQKRAVLLQRTLTAFKERFGDDIVNVFRAPGRINLRGMHVDTHGGFLNLMTHQREVVVVAAPTGTPISIAANVDDSFSEVVFDLSKEQQGINREKDWREAIAVPEVADRVQGRRAHEETAWSSYCIGAALRVFHADPKSSPQGLKMMVNSDLPRGAALSSSAALIIASLLAYARCSNIESNIPQLIHAAQDVEWYAGARVGMSDQTAILLGRPDQLLHIAVFARDFSLDGARYTTFPEALDLLVVNSHTRRTLSGAERLEYSRNRFAYSMALIVLRAELKHFGWTSKTVMKMDRLSRITPDTLGGVSNLYQILQRIPEMLSIKELQERYHPPNLTSEYTRYFGELDTKIQPTHIPLRGPLLFGIAESERARLFPKVLEEGDYERAGQLMSVGHDGDRVHSPDGTPFSTNISDAMMAVLSRKKAAVILQPGAYGASSPALDILVDTALEAGALGASLTGAGIAGAILVLCRKENTTAIHQALAQILQQESYARHANLSVPLDAETAAQSIVINQSTSGAGELIPD
ncbi:MAG: hypothetical protein KAH38_11340 [Candidatus Hydrogenedentes bacterium]|nr:hypothetical protein [Candidatus Hydrogenedentota bacterium]